MASQGAVSFLDIQALGDDTLVGVVAGVWESGSDDSDAVDSSDEEAEGECAGDNEDVDQTNSFCTICH